MKKLFFAGCALMLGGTLSAADDPALKFGGERIGVPSLSLSESGAQGALAPKPEQRFGTDLPRFSHPRGFADGGLNLLPRRRPDVAALEAARIARAPRVSRQSGMPIIEPSSAIDYSLTVVQPNPAMDFKMVVKDPSPGLPAESGK